MIELLVLGGALVGVLLFRWGARKLFFSRWNRFMLDGKLYQHHGPGHFTTDTGARIADRALLARLEEEWEISTNAHLAQQRGGSNLVMGEYDRDGPPPPRRRRRWWHGLGDLLDFLSFWR